jgi:ABC-type uncharacterized transport system substrate-binding protein
MHRRLLASLVALTVSTAPALAHPHVWVTAKTEVLYGQDGRVSGIRHAWTFDEAYSAFAVQGLDKNRNGKLEPSELAELAQVNVESLHEFDFFTFAKASGAKQDFDRPVNYRLAFENARLTLYFTLPMKQNAANQRTFTLEVYDPTWFVSFELAPGDEAVTLVNPPRGCTRNITRPRPPEVSQQRLTEDFFSSLSGANFGANFANRVLIACP